jgi:predicted ATPase
VALADADSPEKFRAKLIQALGDEEDAELLAQRVAETIGLAEVVGAAEERSASVLSLFQALARTGKLNATLALLEPLSDDECALLIENLVGRAELPEEVERRIAEAAEGNPLFVQLDAGERAVIERAAVQGKIFYDEAVADLAGEALTAGVADSLGSLVRKELIRTDRASLGGRTHRFRHLLIRDAAYDAIPREARAETHERFAHWLERAAGGRGTEYEEIVGYHLDQAYRYRAELGPVDEPARALGRAAAERLGAAGQRAFSRSDAPAALNLISRAVSLLPPQDPLRVDLVPSVRVVQGMDDLSWADTVLTEAVEAAATSGDRRLAAHALAQRGLLRLFTASNVTTKELMDVAEQAI